MVDLRSGCALQCERGLAVRPRTCECRCVPLNCGYVPVWIDLCGLVRVASADGSLTMITRERGLERAEGCD
jgi:hypothetical protein